VLYKLQTLLLTGTKLAGGKLHGLWLPKPSQYKSLKVSGSFYYHNTFFLPKKLISVLNTISISNTIAVYSHETFALQPVVSISILTLFGNYNKEMGNEQVWWEHLLAELKVTEDVLQKFKYS